MTRHRRAPTAVFVSFAGALALGACGGGGGGGGGGGVVGGGGGVGSASGTIAFFGGSSVVAEAEPNDSLGQAHAIGSLVPGRRVTVLGGVDATDDADPFDGFRVRTPQRVKVTATVVYAPLGGSAVELEVYDPTALQVVESFPLAGSPTTATFFAQRACDLVVPASAGGAHYQVALDAVSAPSPILEREPNGSFGDDQSLGEVVVGDVVTTTGAVDAATDAVDAFLVSCPVTESLSLSLAI